MEENKNLVHQYQPFLQELNVEGITFPTPIDQIPKFEQVNNISINVFGLENDVVVPIQLSRHWNQSTAYQQRWQETLLLDQTP